MYSAVIMAGGEGTRFWPASRKSNPKQFLKLTGDKTMIRETAERVSLAVNTERIFVVTTAVLAGRVAAELDFLPRENIIAEPEGRNTAPCVALAMAAVRSGYGPEEVVAVLPADHRIGDREQYLKTLKAVFRYIKINPSGVAAFGIRPVRPETGYGYIQAGRVVHRDSGVEILQGIRFVEKPDIDRARRYVESGGYLWNSGMFVLKAGTFFDLCARHLPEIYAEIDLLEKNINEAGRLKEVYARLPAVSFDKGIMEKLDSFLVAPGDFGWDDLGSWLALEKSLPMDGRGNVVVGDFIGVDVENSIIFSDGARAVAAVGIKGLIVVVRDDVVMVCPRDGSQLVRDLVEEVRRRGREDLI